MARTLAARRLTEAHRLAQLRIGARTVKQMFDVFPLLDPSDLDASFTNWLTAANGVVQAQRTESAALASTYLATFRTIELGAPPPPPPVLRFPAEALATSMLVTGPVSMKANIGRAMPVERAAEIAKAYSAGSAMRFALNAGRETILGNVKADPQARGFARVASPTACDYCSDLAGIEFPTDEVFEAHDHCACSCEPVY